MIVRLLRILMAGGILVFATAAQAQGQDPKLWYVSFGAGAAWFDDADFSAGASPSADTGYMLSGAFGRYIDDIKVVRLEAEALYDSAEINNVSGLSSSGTLSNAAVMFNIYYDFRTSSNWTPYFGGGIGYARVDFDSLSTGGVTLLDDSADAFAWQVKAGVAYEFSPAWAINIGYRYYGTDTLGFTAAGGIPAPSDGIRVQNAEVGFRFSF